MNKRAISSHKNDHHTESTQPDFQNAKQPGKKENILFSNIPKKAHLAMMMGSSRNSTIKMQSSQKNLHVSCEYLPK